MRVQILMGKPGVGKTRRAQLRAEETGAVLVYHLVHAWTDADELFYGVDVAAAVAGDAANVRQEGVLGVAARHTLAGRRVVLVLDELDKASEATENLLLDFLQSGRVPTAPGQQIQADLDLLEVFITSNNVRPLSEALLRRGRRVWMQPLPFEQQAAIIAEKTGAAPGFVRLAWRAAISIAEAEGNDALSLQEGWNLIEELLTCSSMEEVRSAYSGWAVRREEGLEALRASTQLAAVWGELRAMRK